MNTRTESFKSKAANGADDLAAQIDTLRDDLSRLTDTVSRLTRSGIADAQDLARQKAGEARDMATQQIGEVEDMVRRNPLQAALIAVGLGFLIGAMSRR
ncbi:MAG: YqjD family protein [Hyphomicrobiales bacterium]